MAILGVLDEQKFTTLDESLKPLYRQNSDNKNYYLDIPPDEAAKLAFNQTAELERLRKHSETVLGEKKAIQDQLKPYQSIGKTPDEIKAELEAKNPEEIGKVKAEYETKIASVNESWTEKYSQIESMAKQRQEQLEKTLVNAQISKLRADYDLNDTADFVLRDFIRPETDESGNISLKVYENGEPALTAGQPKKPEQLIESFRDSKKFLSMFNANGGGGTGATNNQGRFTNNNKLDGLHGVEKLKAAREMQGS
jgi:hypothetical protein